jgi:hypothetical protein
MEDKHLVARATALLASNAYALIQTMTILSADVSRPKLALLVVLIPAGGMTAAYNMLQRPYRWWDEAASIVCVAVMLAFWMARWMS